MILCFVLQTSGSRLKRLAHFTGGSHNQTWECPGYCEVMNKFLLEVRWRLCFFSNFELSKVNVLVERHSDVNLKY